MPGMRRFRQAERTASRVIDGASFVIAIDSQVLLELNDVGTHIWERLAAPSTVDALAQAVAEEFEVDPVAAQRDVESFLGTLVERGVVTEDSGTT